MLICDDEDGMIFVVESGTCAYHQLHPGKPFASCCCWTSCGWRAATPAERAERRRKRLTARQAELEAELAAINCELGPPADAHAASGQPAASTPAAPGPGDPAPGGPRSPTVF